MALCSTTLEREDDSYFHEQSGRYLNTNYGKTKIKMMQKITTLPIFKLASAVHDRACVQRRRMWHVHVMVHFRLSIENDFAILNGTL